MIRYLAVGLLLSAPSLLAAEPAPSPNYVDAIAQSRALIRNDLAPKVPGLAVAVFINGTSVWNEAFGYADLRQKKPATTTTRFRIGSVSKTISSVALAHLVQEGQIDMDASIQRYIPDYSKRNPPITVRQLAGHLSGIRNYKNSEALSDVPYPNLRSALKIFEDDPLLARPGDAYSYSSYNWNVIGAIIEAVTHQDFPGYVDAQILRPLGMKNTRLDFPKAVDRSRTQFYELGPHGDFVDAPEVDSSYKWPSGGFLSTPEDLAAFGSALLQPGFLDQKSLDLLFTAQKTNAGNPIRYGVGWGIGRNYYFHGGDVVGGTAALILIPHSRTVIAFACNRDSFLLDGTNMGRLRLRGAPDQWSSKILIRTGLRLAKLFNRSPSNAQISGSETPPAGG